MLRVTRDCGDEVLELQRIQLLVALAQRARVVDDQRVAATALQDQRRQVVLGIKGRVLADHDRREVAQRPANRRAETWPRAGTRDRTRIGVRITVVQAETAERDDVGAMAAAQRLGHQQKAGVDRGVQGFRRVDDEEQTGHARIVHAAHRDGDRGDP